MADFSSESNYTNDGILRAQKKDLIVGIMSCANYSAFKENGIGYTLTSRLEDWVQEILTPKVFLFEFICLHNTVHP